MNASISDFIAYIVLKYSITKQWRLVRRSRVVSSAHSAVDWPRKHTPSAAGVGFLNLLNFALAIFPRAYSDFVVHFGPTRSFGGCGRWWSATSVPIPHPLLNASEIFRPLSYMTIRDALRRELPFEPGSFARSLDLVDRYYGEFNQSWDSVSVFPGADRLT